MPRPQSPSWAHYQIVNGMWSKRFTLWLTVILRRFPRCPLLPMTESDKLFWKWSAGTSRLPQAAQMLNVCSRMVGLLPQTTVPAYLARNLTRYSSSARTPWWQTLTLAGCRPDALLYIYFQHWIKKECWLIGILWTELDITIGKNW